MSLFRRVLYALCPLILFGIGVVQLLRSWQALEWSRVIDAQLAMFPPLSVILWWALLVVIPVFLLLLAVESALTRRILVLKTQSGQPLKIREAAVSRYLHARLMELSFVRSVRIVARGRGGALGLRVRIWVEATQQLDNLQERVASKIVADARDGFGLTQVLEPDIQFEAVKVGKKRRGAGEREGGYETSEEAPLPVPPPEGVANFAGKSS